MVIEMNVKGFNVNNMIPFDGRAKSADKKEKIRSEASRDRDADGRRHGGDEQKQESPPTPEQIENAVSYLENHPGVKDNQLKIKKVERDGKILLLIEDQLGKVVRRIPQTQIHFLSQSKDDDSSKGRLYDKAT